MNISTYIKHGDVCNTVNNNVKNILEFIQLIMLLSIVSLKNNAVEYCFI